MKFVWGIQHLQRRPTVSSQSIINDMFDSVTLSNSGIDFSYRPWSNVTRAEHRSMRDSIAGMLSLTMILFNFVRAKWTTPMNWITWIPLKWLTRNSAIYRFFDQMQMSIADHFQNEDQMVTISYDRSVIKNKNRSRWITIVLFSSKQKFQCRGILPIPNGEERFATDHRHR